MPSPVGAWGDPWDPGRGQGGKEGGGGEGGRGGGREGGVGFHAVHLLVVDHQLVLVLGREGRKERRRREGGREGGRKEGRRERGREGM